MKRTRYFVLAAAIIVLFASGASALTILPTSGTGDGSAGRDWYSNPNYYWVDDALTTVGFTHQGYDKWSLRGAVIIDISSLAGVTLGSGSTTFNFYSLGISGTSLQHYDSDPGDGITTGFALAGGTQIASLELGEGWQSYDVTDLVNGDIASGRNHAAFIFNVVSNGGGGSIIASEFGGGYAANLKVVPEPSSALALLAGFPAAAIWGLRRRK